MDKLNQNWNLEVIYNSTNELHVYLHQLEEDLQVLARGINSFSTISIVDANKMTILLLDLGMNKGKLSQATSYITCLLAQNPLDEKATLLQGKVTKLSSQFEHTLTKAKNIIAQISPELWEVLIESPIVNDFKFILIEWRNAGNTSLTHNEQAMLSSLTTDGYHAWGQMYQTLMGNLKIELQIEGKKHTYSVGQALNLRAHPDEHIRKFAHESLEKEWAEHQQNFAKILNHLVGFRIQMNQLQGIEDALDEPLRKNRMKKKTLDAMWSAVSKHKQPFVSYLNHKAKMNHDGKMQAFNFWAPIASVGNKIHFDDAINLIVEHFSKFGPKLKAFAVNAFEDGWVEAENRPGKSSVAFCASFPMSAESRVFMTFDGTMKSVLTLVHELGHAFHNFAMTDISGLNREYPLSIAETASTFAEMIVLEAAMENATSIQEKISLLDEKLKRSVMNFMNIHSRFLFELKFYEERKKGLVAVHRINELMHEAIKEGYEDSVEEVSVYTWLWTPHFYITKAPFYNFPYTFGYLFALCLFAKYKEMGTAFENAYIQLLRDSGKMSTEELVLKHLNEDITSEEFWEKGLKLCVQDVELFLQLTALN
ncbi:MAG: M3 family oligoendopeptidase [Solibacillus sp.]|uniref:M3 family oligoendopeptidase n=1 Tax=Solibacillus sp. TaxID=1909654 RepID=UPI0033158DA6